MSPVTACAVPPVFYFEKVTFFQETYVFNTLAGIVMVIMMVRMMATMMAIDDDSNNNSKW